MKALDQFFKAMRKNPKPLTPTTYHPSKSLRKRKNGRATTKGTQRDTNVSFTIGQNSKD